MKHILLLLFAKFLDKNIKPPKISWANLFALSSQNFEMLVTCLDRVSANSEKGIGL